MKPVRSTYVGPKLAAACAEPGFLYPTFPQFSRPLCSIRSPFGLEILPPWGLANLCCAMIPHAVCSVFHLTLPYLSRYNQKFPCKNSICQQCGLAEPRPRKKDPVTELCAATVDTCLNVPMPWCVLLRCCQQRQLTDTYLPVEAGSITLVRREKKQTATGRKLYIVHHWDL